METYNTKAPFLIEETPCAITDRDLDRAMSSACRAGGLASYLHDSRTISALLTAGYIAVERTYGTDTTGIKHTYRATELGRTAFARANYLEVKLEG